MPNFNEQPNFDLKVPTLPNYNIGWLHRFNEALQALVNRTRYLYENGTGTSVEIVNNLTTSDATKALSAEMGVFIAESFGQAIADLIQDVALKADLDSPNFTGNPAAPTQVQGTNDGKLATTQFVNDAVYNAINALISSAPENLNQLNELATALNNDPNFATTVLSAVANKLAIDVVMTLTTQQKNNVFASLGLQAGATAQNTDGLGEGSNKYFTEARVLASVLAGLVTTNSSAVVATDTVLVALGKLQKQASDLFANQRYQFLNDSTTAQTTYTVPASAVTENGRTIIELTNASLTSITVNAATGVGKIVGDSVYVKIMQPYTAQALLASGVSLEGDLTFSYQYQTKCLAYKGSNTWSVVG